MRREWLVFAAFCSFWALFHLLALSSTFEQAFDLSPCLHVCWAWLTPTSLIKQVHAEASTHSFASICIPSSLLPYAATLTPPVPLCTVVGFPNGNCLSAVKAYEATAAMDVGACEIDMVINVGNLKRFSACVEVDGENVVGVGGDVGDVLDAIVGDMVQVAQAVSGELMRDASR